MKSYNICVCMNMKKGVYITFLVQCFCRKFRQFERMRRYDKLFSVDELPLPPDLGVTGPAGPGQSVNTQ